MNDQIRNLYPQCVWRHFDDITQVPRPSHHEDRIREFLVDFAKRNGIECTVDAGLNVIMRKPAYPGMENRKPVVLQAHMDMVPQKDPDKEFNFETDAIQAYVSGDRVTADGTTLGADNGIGVSAILAVMESKDIKHGPLEALITATEETGMFGANGLKPGELKADILLNLDTENDEELIIGCAGGLDFNATIPFETVRMQKGVFSGYRLTLKGLKGGHSGLDIALQRGNSNKLMARFLKLYQEKFGIVMCSIDGGGLRNAIPRSTVCDVAVMKDHEKSFLRAVRKYSALINSEYAGIEDQIVFTAEPIRTPARCIDLFDQCNLIDAVIACPNGVARMNPSIPGMVQTSTNLARVVSGRNSFRLHALLRSSVESEKNDLAMTMSTVLEMANGKVRLTGGYQGWQPNTDSEILGISCGIYSDMFHKEPNVGAVHAGLECGIIGGKYPKMDMISFGPSIFHPHSPAEEVDIASVGRFWEYLTRILESIPEK